MERQKVATKLYYERLDDVKRILETARQEVLPQVVTELRQEHGVEVDVDVMDWLEDWVDDIGQMYRLFNKQLYDVDATLRSVHDILIWRVKNLLDTPQPTRPCSFLRFLPHPLLQRMGKPSSAPKCSAPPILLLNLKELIAFLQSKNMSDAQKTTELKYALVTTLELAWSYLREMDLELNPPTRMTKPSRKNTSSVPDRALDVEITPRILQCVLMVDARGAGMLPNLTNLGSDITTWANKELAPNFPGLCSNVYVVNYSWAHGAVWAIVKRLLPSRVLERVSFPSNADLLRKFPPECIGQEYGGLLPPLVLDRDEVVVKCYPKVPNSAHYESASTSTLVEGVRDEPPSASLPDSRPPLSPAESPPPSLYLESWSPRNPYFGYPTIIHYHRLPDGSIASEARLVHGRRRKRDLYATIFVLRIIALKRWLLAWLVRPMSVASVDVQTWMTRKWQVIKTVSRLMGVRSGSISPLYAAVGLMVVVAVIVQVRRRARLQTAGTLVEKGRMAWTGLLLERLRRQVTSMTSA